MISPDGDAEVAHTESASKSMYIRRRPLAVSVLRLTDGPLSGRLTSSRTGSGREASVARHTQRPAPWFSRVTSRA